MRSLERIGEREIRATTAIAARFGDQRINGVAEMLADGSPLARHVRAIRELAQAFARLREDSSASDRRRIAAEIARREDEIRSLAAALADDRGALMSENASLNQQELALHQQILKLQQYDALLERVDQLVEDHIALALPTDPERARGLQTNVLYVVRQRRRDLLMHLAVAAQAHATLRTVEHGNLAVIRSLAAAETTTLTALRTAGLAISGGVDEWADLLARLDDIDGRRRTS